MPSASNLLIVFGGGASHSPKEFHSLFGTTAEGLGRERDARETKREEQRERQTEKTVASDPNLAVWLKGRQSEEKGEGKGQGKWNGGGRSK